MIDRTVYERAAHLIEKQGLAQGRFEDEVLCEGGPLCAAAAIAYALGGDYWRDNTEDGAAWDKWNEHCCAFAEHVLDYEVNFPAPLFNWSDDNPKETVVAALRHFAREA